jgi:hypothetical protein
MATIYITADDTVSLADALARDIRISLPNQEWFYWNEDTQSWEIVEDIYVV